MYSENVPKYRLHGSVSPQLHFLQQIAVAKHAG